MKLRIVMALCVVALQVGAATVVFAEAPVVKAGDTLQKVLEGYKGKRVTIRLQGGEELTGRVKIISMELLHLEALNSREFFDAVVDVSRIEALIVRVKE
jgi:lipopolysaccharide export LptBFGC system permease protein LptF